MFQSFFFKFRQSSITMKKKTLLLRFFSIVEIVIGISCIALQVYLFNYINIVYWQLYFTTGNSIGTS